MKKKILSLAVIAMSMFSINAVAQNPTTNNAPAKECKKECKASQCNDKKCDKQCPALFFRHESYRRAAGPIEGFAGEASNQDASAC